ncbi:ABC transporter substrate-binding protein [Arenimonas caeni]|jgi:NitT/TauT family transport system substrate-binding protein|uniref:ABC transporter substrate-binding protein n=1 Tax=Arenimonas caeni TaxID=2058085 RepID=UPI002A36495D|nr:ABC transporter substrate-binding protein [Arenimonas caeni]MDY0022152.1 ABC transporter substrate-binding protein [Arenimonas caeni]
MPDPKPRSKFAPLAWFLPLMVMLGALFWLVSLVAPPAPPKPLLVSIGPWIGYEPLVLAREQDWLGPQLRIVETLSNTETAQALRDGSADVGAVTLDEAIRLYAEGVPIRVISVLSDSRGADGVVVAPGVDGIAGLRGQPVLVEDSAVGYHVLHSALAEAGMEMEDVRIVRVQSSVVPVRWRNGGAAGAVVFEPMLSELLDEGAVLAFSTADHPGLVLHVLVAREEVLRSRRPALRELLAAWDRAAKAFARPDLLPLDMLVAGGRLDVRDYRAALDGVAFLDGEASRRMMAGEPSELSRNMRALAASLRRAGLEPGLRIDERILAPEVGAGP